MLAGPILATLDGYLTFGLLGGADAGAVPFEVELQTYLSDALAVTVWPGALPANYKQSDLPALVYSLASHESEDELEGPSSLSEWTIRLEAYGRSILDAAGLMERVKANLHGYRGMMGSTMVQRAMRQGGSHDYSVLPGKSGQLTQVRSAEFWICYEEETT